MPQIRKYDCCCEGGAVTLYHDNAAKLATTATGIDVTGTVAAGAGTALLPSITTTGDLNTGMWFLPQILQQILLR
jgi:hypothetical protein